MLWQMVLPDLLFNVVIPLLHLSPTNFKLMKVVTLFILFLIICSQLYAQEIHIDSSEIKRKIAISDGKYFKPTKQIRKAYRNRTLTNTSDYFNPTAQTVSNSALLKDSAYVNSFKKAAYKNSVRKIKVNRRIITGIIVIAGLVALPFVVVKGLNSLLSDARSTL